MTLVAIAIGLTTLVAYGCVRMFAQGQYLVAILSSVTGLCAITVSAILAVDELDRVFGRGRG